VGATTLFATHYHDLTALAAEYARVRNLHFAADGERGDRRSSGGRPTADGDVTFLHRVAEGPASSSYGVEVARMAGVPEPVVERSRALVEGTDPETNGHDEDVQVTPSGVDADDDGERTGATEGDEAVGADLAAALRDADLARTTPIEALNLLADLKERVEES
jgi:DNA mismatch repair protein MutS